jgi:hypothetical protein
MDIIRNTYTELKCKVNTRTVIEEICFISMNELMKHHHFSAVIVDIISDLFMGRVFVSKNCDLILTLTEMVLKSVQTWYELSEHLHVRLSDYHLTSFKVYRGVKNMNIQERIYQPLPFSCCCEYQNALQWILPSKEDSFIIVIDITLEKIPLTFTGNLEEGNEVILPAGDMYHYFEWYDTYKQVKIVEYKFIPATYNEFCKNLQNKVKLNKY